MERMNKGALLAESRNHHFGVVQHEVQKAVSAIPFGSQRTVKILENLHIATNILGNGVDLNV